MRKAAEQSAAFFKAPSQTVAFASEIGGDQIVGAPASANIDPGSGGTDHITIGIEGAQKTGFVEAGIRLNSPPRTIVDKK